MGSLEVGKLADLVILNENPLEDIRRTESIDKVVQNGKVFSADTLDEIWPHSNDFETGWWTEPLDAVRVKIQ